MVWSCELFGFFCINSKLASKQPMRMAARSFLLPTRRRRWRRRLRFVRLVFTAYNAACLISGLTDVGPVSVERVNRWLWQKVVGLSAYRNLSPGRKVMAEELMDLVHGP